MKATKFLKTADVEKKWILIDAEGVIAGRLASYIALRLRGKHRPDYTPHIDCGDHVIVINADKVALTGNKLKDKKYYWHTGYPGGIKERTAGKILDGKFPERVMEKAVKRMLPKESPLARKQFSNLYVFSGSEYDLKRRYRGAPPKPEVIDFKAMNPKNSREG